MKTVVSLIAKIRAVKGPNEADKGVYNYFFDGEKYGVEEPASGEGRRYAGPFTLRAQSVLIGNSLTTLFGFESAVPSGGEVAYLNNPASNIGTENPYLAVVYHKDHLGSTRAITKVDGTILEQNDYYPFGLRTTRGENYSTLSESLAAIAQNANNTTANTVVPEYLYNGKEKQDFIKNTSAVINAGGSADYTSNYIDYGARFYNPTTLRWNTQDPMAEKYQRYSPYNYCVNNPINLVDLNGEAWQPTFRTNDDGETTWTGFLWVEESESYNDDGSLKEGLYHQAIFFSDNGTFDPSSRYNIKSSTATVYLANGETATFDACTQPSDLKAYPTVPEGFYIAYVGIHNGKKSSYKALKMKDKGAEKQTIELGDRNPAHPDKTTASGIDIHRAGINDVTGRTKDGGAVSEGCILISSKEWNRFMGIFNVPQQLNNEIGVIISRSNSTPSIRDKKPSINAVNKNYKDRAKIGNK